VAQKPGGTAFNPLLIYGGVGLGKTHLTHAIGIEIKRNHPEKTILYVPAEKFTQQFIEAVKNNTMGDFQQFYQMMDVLIIDDVQFLAGKEKTQDVFFHIFNHLHQSGKQLVITSDKAPVEMSGMEQRLLSRFKWGLSADLQRRRWKRASPSCRRRCTPRASTCRKKWWSTWPTASPPTSANSKGP
jgi:chromosomal replication initiator protein